MISILPSSISGTLIHLSVFDSESSDTPAGASSFSVRVILSFSLSSTVKIKSSLYEVPTMTDRVTFPFLKLGGKLPVRLIHTILNS